LCFAGTTGSTCFKTYCLIFFIRLRPKLGNTYYHIIKLPFNKRILPRFLAYKFYLPFLYFLECTVVQCKDALSIYWNRHGHECSRIWKLSANFTLIQCIKIVSRFNTYRNTDEVWWRYGICRSCDEWLLLVINVKSRPQYISALKKSRPRFILAWKISTLFWCIKIISLSNIRPIIIYFHSSQWRLIPYLHQRPIFFKPNSSIVAILEVIRGVQCLIEVIRSSGEEMWRVDAYNTYYHIMGRSPNYGRNSNILIPDH
jgi:hypothetical protein